MDYKKIRDDLKDLQFNIGTNGLILDFPLKSIPKENTLLHSPRVGKHHGVEPFDKTKYEEYMWEVVAVRDQVQKGIYPIEFLRKHYPEEWGTLPMTLPTILKKEGLSHLRVSGLASVVHMDKPTDLGFAMMNYLGSRKKADRMKQGNSSHVDFLERGPNLISGLSDAIKFAINKAFEVKYYYGIARPEEVYEYLTGNKGTDLTHYGENMSYTHPSYVAGHATIASATGKFFQDNCVLDEEENTEIRRTAYLWAQFRTLAGVHYAVDNLAGLKLGGIK